MLTVGIDVDNVLFDAGLNWFEWCRETHGISTDLEMEFKNDWLSNKAEFSFKKYFPHVDYSKVVGYWFLPDIYDNVIIDPVVVEAVNKIRAEFDVVFVSHVLGNHGFSKERMLRKHFGGKDMKHIFTEHKQYVNLDFLIDDRYKNFVRSHTTYGIYFKTPYIDDVPKTPVNIAIHTDNWGEITKYLGVQ